MTVGDQIRVIPTIDGIQRPAATATVIYIHPKRRFYTVEYTVPGGRLRESFQFRYRRPDNPGKGEQDGPFNDI